MRLAERQKIAAQKAKLILAPDDYRELVWAMSSGDPVTFEYTNRFGDESEYHTEYVESFFELPKKGEWPGSVNVWSYHDDHEKKEQYNVERIQNVGIFGDLVRAVLNPVRYSGFWAGVSLFPAETKWWQEAPSPSFLEALAKKSLLYPKGEAPFMPELLPEEPKEDSKKSLLYPEGKPKFMEEL